MFYTFAKAVFWFLFRVIYRVRVSGCENIPAEGAFLLCGNHIHAFDGALVLAFTPRRLALMAKKELFKNPILAFLFRAGGIFPVDREAAADMAAYRHTLKQLEAGSGLLIFSQGTRMKDFDNAKSGVAMFALKSGAPIVPVGIRGSYRPFSRLTMRIGQPIPMTPYEGRKIKADLLAEVMAEVVPRVTDLTKITDK